MLSVLLFYYLFYTLGTYDLEGGLKKLLEKYENRYEKSIGAVISR